LGNDSSGCLFSLGAFAKYSPGTRNLSRSSNSFTTSYPVRSRTCGAGQNTINPISDRAPRGQAGRAATKQVVWRGQGSSAVGGFHSLARETHD